MCLSALTVRVYVFCMPPFIILYALHKIVPLRRMRYNIDLCVCMGLCVAVVCFSFERTCQARARACALACAATSHRYAVCVSRSLRPARERAARIPLSVYGFAHWSESRDIASVFLLTSTTTTSDDVECVHAPTITTQPQHRKTADITTVRFSSSRVGCCVFCVRNLTELRTDGVA